MERALGSALRDYQLPAAVRRPVLYQAAAGGGASYVAARWNAAALANVAAVLARGAGALQSVSDQELLDAWADTVEAFLDPRSPERRDLAPALAATSNLSPAGLAAALAAVVGGVRREAAGAVLRRGAALRQAPPRAAAAARPGFAGGAPALDGPRAGADADAPVLVILASNLPGLAVQPLLAALALRRPVLLKSSSAEPLFAPAFVAALARREPCLGEAIAAVTWRGGDADLEAPLLAAVGTVVAYGEAATVADLRRRAAAPVVAYGPKMSLAVVAPGGDVDLAAVAAGLARDVALLDQRGCLSVVAVYVSGGAGAASATGVAAAGSSHAAASDRDRAGEAALRLAAALHAALADLAELWPPGAAPVGALAAVQHARLSGEMEGAWSVPPAGSPLAAPAAGTVLVEPDPRLRPSPGLRTVRVHPLADLNHLPGILAPWTGRLQGAALAGAAAWDLVPRLTELGLSRFAAPGDLQAADASWQNGGVDLLAALAAPQP